MTPPAALKTKSPLTLISVLLIITAVILAQVFNLNLDVELTRIGVVVAAITSVVTLLKTEQTHYDLNNGVVVDKVSQALAASNVPGGDAARNDVAASVTTTPATVLHPDVLAQLAAVVTAVNVTLSKDLTITSVAKEGL